MIKIFLNKDGSIAKYEPVQYKEVVADFDINDSLVIDDITSEIVRIQNSSQGKKRLEELKTSPELTDVELAELKFLAGEASIDKEEDKAQLVKLMEEGYLYLANMNDIVYIHEIKSAIDQGMEYDEERGDRVFKSVDEAIEYAKSLNLDYKIV